MRIFVFGSNLAGRHGKGAALYARQHYGAIYGQGVGLQGQSYAIPTKDEHLHTLPLHVIQDYLFEFILFTIEHPEHTYELTPIGTGLAGYSIEDLESILPTNLPDNIQCLWRK